MNGKIWWINRSTFNGLAEEVKEWEEVGQDARLEEGEDDL